MIPKELKRDADGFTRFDRLEFADFTIRESRQIVAGDNFAAYADQHCPDCGDARTCGMNWYRDGIWDAANAYRSAGLGLRADRVEALEAGTLDAWTAFDEANATTEV